MTSSSNLCGLSVGARAVVASVDCDRPVRRRLLELGLLPGTAVEVMRRAPLGDPIELSLRGYRLSIRGDEARAVLVRDVILGDAPASAGPAAFGVKEP